MKSLFRILLILKTVVESSKTGNRSYISHTDNGEPSRSAAGPPTLYDGFQENSATTQFDGYDNAGVVTADRGALSEMQTPNCAWLYCERHHLRPEQFVSALFWKSLYPRARYFGFPIIVLLPRAFSADRDFIARVGQVETMEQYEEVEADFHRWPGCRSFLRGKLSLRVTSRHVRRLVEDLLAREG